MAVEWRQYAEPDAIVAAVDRYSVLESAGWKGRNGTALHPDNLQGEFFRRVMQRFAHRASARVWELWIDGQLAASRLAIGTPDMLVMLKTTYDEQLARYAPGMLLLRQVIETYEKLSLGTAYSDLARQVKEDTRQILTRIDNLFEKEDLYRTSRRLARWNGQRPPALDAFDVASGRK